MKKLLAILVCLAMLMSLASCFGSSESEDNGDKGGMNLPGFSNDTPGGAENDEADEDENDDFPSFGFGDDEEEDEKKPQTDAVKKPDTIIPDRDFCVGTYGSRTYENEFLGLGCTVESGWTMGDEEFLAESNGVSTHDVSSYRNSYTFFDMYTEDGRGNSMNIVFENVGESELESYDISEIFDGQLSALTKNYNDMGFTDVEFEEGYANVAGERYTALYTCIGNGQIQLYQGAVCIKCGDYLVSITVGTVNEDRVSDLFDLFYNLD